MSKMQLLGAIVYAAVPFLIGVYILLVDAGILKDKSGKDEFYQWIKSNRLAFLLGATALMIFAGFEFFRFLAAFK